MVNLKNKKVISVVGARPNFMKVAPIDRAFAEYIPNIEHIIVHTGQHYDKNMSDAFFQDLEMPDPKYFLGIGSGSHSEQTAKVMVAFEKILTSEKPDLVIVVGDVNSTIACTLTAVKMHIKVAHVESGLRSFDRAMPEEINRMATDAICDFCFVTEDAGRKHLQESNFPEDKIFFVGNTMIDSQVYALGKINDNILEKYNLEKNNYSLLTIHRPSNVDKKEKLEMLVDIFSELAKKIKLVFPIHPRTLKNLEKFDLLEKFNKIENIVKIEPAGYLDFLSLMKNSKVVITDSGGIQEETTALGVQCLTLRENTERPSTIEIGTNQLIKLNKNAIILAVEDILNNKIKTGTVPPLWDGQAAERIVNKINEII